MKTCLFAFLTLIVFSSYAQTSRLLKDHKYSAVISGATARLNANSEDKKAKLILQQAYNEALAYFQAELVRIQASNDSMKWTKTLEILQETNDLADEIRYNSSASQVICDLKVYTKELEEAKAMAVDELSMIGKVLLTKNTKADARKAYFLFKKSRALSSRSAGIDDLIEKARLNAMYNVVIAPVRIDFNTLNVSTKKIDKEFFYWTQRDVTSRPFIRLYTEKEADGQDFEPDFYIQIDVQDYRVERMASAQSGSSQSGSGFSNLMAIGNLYLKIYSTDQQKIVYKKGITCRYDAQTKSTIRVNTIDLQRTIDPDIQTFFDYLILSNFEQITSEIENYFNTLVKQ
jgi:hypothetical protein